MEISFLFRSNNFVDVSICSTVPKLMISVIFFLFFSLVCSFIHMSYVCRFVDACFLLIILRLRSVQCWMDVVFFSLNRQLFLISTINSCCYTFFNWRLTCGYRDSRFFIDNDYEKKPCLNARNSLCVIQSYYAYFTHLDYNCVYCMIQLSKSWHSMAVTFD